MSSSAGRAAALVTTLLLANAPAALAQEPPMDAHATHSAELHAARAANTVRHVTGEIGRQAALQAAQSAVAAMLDSTRDVMGTPARAVVAPTYREILAMYAAPTGKLSIGTNADGRLTGAATLAARGPHHQVVARSVPRELRHGTPAIIALIEAAAADVARHHPGAILGVGNISRAQGGDIPWSRSHNAGRDADLAFYTKERASGRPAVTPDLFSFAADGTNAAEPQLVFDVPRNWALVRALLTSDAAQVQYLFISDPLKAALLAHAQDAGEPAELIARASRVLHQPTDALPHDDHFHLRIYCPEQDRLLGCMESGPRWPWVDHHDAALFAWSARMGEALGDGDAAVRQDAIKYLIGTRAPHAAEVLLWIGARHEDAATRAAALAGAADAWPWSGSALAGAEALIMRPGHTPEERRAAYNILRRSHEPSVIPFLLARLDAAGCEEAERVWAARALEHLMIPDLVPELITRLTAQPAPVRAELARVLRRIANRADGVDWASADEAALAAGQRQWQAWWEGARGAPREAWMIDGLVQAGLVRGALSVDHVEALIAQLPKAPDHLLYNINRALRQVTGQWGPLDQRNGKKLQTYWKELWKKQRTRVLSRS